MRAKCLNSLRNFKRNIASGKDLFVLENEVRLSKENIDKEKAIKNIYAYVETKNVYYIEKFFEALGLAKFMRML